MKKILLSVFSCIVFLFAGQNTKAQSLKVGVFDIDLMVQAMPGYRVVDSLMQIYEADSLASRVTDIPIGISTARQYL